MYFQKLESLYNDVDIKHKLTIMALDEWLTFVPKSYRDRLSPQMFQLEQEVDFNECFELFNKMTEIGVMAYRYVLECKCGNVISFHDSLEETIQAIITWNNSEEQCLACDKHNNLTTDNVFILYRLVDKPRNISYKKKDIFLNNKTGSSRINLSDFIEKDVQRFEKKIGTEKLIKVGNPNIRNAILALKD